VNNAYELDGGRPQKRSLASTNFTLYVKASTVAEVLINLIRGLRVQHWVHMGRGMLCVLIPIRKLLLVNRQKNVACSSRDSISRLRFGSTRMLGSTPCLDMVQGVLSRLCQHELCSTLWISLAAFLTRESQ